MSTTDTDLLRDARIVPETPPETVKPSAPKLVRVAVLDDYQGVATQFADWTSLSSKIQLDVFPDTIRDEDSLIKRLGPFQIICSMRERTKFSRNILEKLPNLRLLSTTGMRNAAIDLETAARNGVIVSGTDGGSASTNEHNWALIMAVTRYLVREHQNTRDGNSQWQTSIPFELSGRTLGVLGLGRLGTSTAKIAQAFGMKVLAWSPNLTPERAEAAGVSFAETKEELFKSSDIISIHLVLAPSTTNLVAAKELALMKPTAFLVNTSRGPIVNETDLIDTLVGQKIAGAGLDVFDIEPLPLNHPLRTLDNVTLSPHLGYVSDKSYKGFFQQTVENVTGFLDGNPVRVLK